MDFLSPPLAKLTKKVPVLLHYRKEEAVLLQMIPLGEEVVVIPVSRPVQPQTGGIKVQLEHYPVPIAELARPHCGGGMMWATISATLVVGFELLYSSISRGLLKNRSSLILSYQVYTSNCMALIAQIL